jgi:hypothetical protein
LKGVFLLPDHLEAEESDREQPECEIEQSERQSAAARAHLVDVGLAPNPARPGVPVSC